MRAAVAFALALIGAGALGWHWLRLSPHLPARAAPRAPVAARAAAKLAGGPTSAAVVPIDVRDSVKLSAEPERRRALLESMRAWGSRDVVAAVAWALDQESPWCALALEGALNGGAASNPDLAVEVERKLLIADPELGATQVSALIRQLSEAGRLDLALTLAAAAPAAMRHDLAADTFATWARQSPDAALAAVNQISESPLRRAALVALIEGWAATDPESLARRGSTTFTGEDRSYAARQAIDHWHEQDPAGLTRWLAELPPGPERDCGAAIVAADLAKQDPRTAFAWTVAIANSDERFRTLQRVAASVDPTLARFCVDQLAGLAPAERAALLRQLDCTP